MEEKRIYVAVAGTIQVPAASSIDGRIRNLKTVVQPIGRQIAQVAHVVSKLRHNMLKLNIEESNLTGSELVSVAYQRESFIPITTIVLSARDSSEMSHVYVLLLKKKLHPIWFFDENEPIYGRGTFPTALAVLATQKQTIGILDYLPLWGANERP